MNWLAVIFIVWNVIVVLFYGIDKQRAKKRAWRISESGLIIPAFLFASVGAMLGMILFNHKTSKMKFRLLIPLAFVLNVLFVIWLDYMTR